jgi:hypothetical protein
MSCGKADSDAVSVAAPSIAELEPSPKRETQEAASPINVTRPRDHEGIRIRLTLAK